MALKVLRFFKIDFLKELNIYYLLRETPFRVDLMTRSLFSLGKVSTDTKIKKTHHCKNQYVHRSDELAVIRRKKIGVKKKPRYVKET